MNVPATSTITPGGSINLKGLLITAIIAIIITLLVSKATKNEVVLRDANGNIVAVGDIKTSLKTGK